MIRAPAEAVTLRFRTTYWGEDGCMSKASTAGCVIPSGPARALATRGRLARGIWAGSAKTRSVWTVMARTRPSLVVIEPRTAGIDSGDSRRRSARFW